jgi:hypothetical protein
LFADFWRLVIKPRIQRMVNRTLLDHTSTITVGEKEEE